MVIKDFLRQNLKFVIIALVIILIIVVVIILGIASKKYYDEINVYKTIEYSYFGMYSVDDKVGVVDKNGNVIVEPEYVDIYIPNPEEAVFFCYTVDNSYVILNDNGEELFTEYDNVTVLQTSESNLDFEKYVLKYEKDGKYGLIDFSGTVVANAEYDSIESLEYKPGEILVEKDDKYGVLNSSGEIKIKIKYDSIKGDEYYNNSYSYRYTGYIVGEKTDEGYLYGYFDNNGNKVLDVNFESISRILKYDDIDSYLVVMNNGKKGLYKNSQEIISQNYQNIIYAENSNVFVVQRNSKYGIFGVSGKEILPVQYVGYSLAGDYISVENEDGSKELYDVNGNKISNLNYTNIQSAGETNCYIAVDENGYYSIIGNGDTISDNYIYISYAFDNYFIFKNENNVYGLLDVYSGVIIEPEYTIMLVIDGKNAIEAEKADGMVDIYSENIEKIISLDNAIIETIDENYARIYNETEMEYINFVGEKVENTEVYPNNKLYAYNENEKWGFKDLNGNIKIEATYDFVTELNEYGFAGIFKDGKWGVIDEEGNIIEEAIHELETYYLPSFIGKYKLELTDTYHCLELD